MNRLEALGEYENAFRSLMNDKIFLRDTSPRTSLRLNKEEDWGFLCVAMDIIGDANSALMSFVRFGLDGPTRYDDIGEKYLRLYGLVSAAYAQQQATQRLFELMNCPHPREVRSQLEKLKIRMLRHQIASHSLDYLEPNGRVERPFVPVQISLGGYSLTVAEGEAETFVDYDLMEALNEHFELLVGLIDQIFEKTYKTIYKGMSKKLSHFAERLKELRLVRDGMVVIKVPGKDGFPHKVLIIPKKSGRDT